MSRSAGGSGVSLFARLIAFLRSDRGVRMPRQDQLTMAWMGHLLILIGVSAILLIWFDNLVIRGTLIAFAVIEALIVVFGVLATISTRQIVSALDGTVVSMDSAEEWMYGNPNLKDRVQDGIVLLIFAMQFGSMALLLIATGGPIESPFAPMALAIGVFTPFIVNKWWTVILTISATMAFYALIILIVGFGGDPATPEESAFAVVNLFILALASIMTFKRRDSLKFKIRRIVRATQEEVWRAWTDTEQVERWLVPEGGPKPYLSMDVREGGAWEVRLYDGDGSQGTPWSGTYRELREFELLEFTIDTRSGLGEEIITLELKKRSDQTTEMVLIQSDNGRLDGLLRGWSGFMEQIVARITIDRRSRPRGGPGS